MMGTTGLHALHVDCIVGVHESERERPQPIAIDVELDYDFAGAADTDDVTWAVDYDAVARQIVELVTRGRFRLLETMGEEIATGILMEHVAVTAVRLIIRKPRAVPAADCSFVKLERARP